jgi:tetratricopeptide (TPR) repeat protein
MVVAEDTKEGTTRYQMLETLGQYARERLDEHGDVDGWRRHHAAYFAGWAEEAGPGLVGRDELAWRARESSELDNLRAAVTWALDRDTPDDIAFALRIIGALAEESEMNPVAGVGAWAVRALHHVEATTPQLRYAVTGAAAWHQFTLGNYQHAQELAHTAIGDGVPLGAPAPDIAHTTLAVASASLGEPERALEIALDAARLLDRDYPGSASAALAHSGAAVFSAMSGDPIAARAEAKVALRQARETANPTLLASALMAYGWVRIADDLTAALAALDESIALHRQGASPVNFGTALCLAAGVRVRTGDLPHAARDLREGVERSHQAGTRPAFYTGVLGAVEILIRLEHLEQAAVLDGIARTGLTPEYRASGEWAHLPAAIEHARTAYGPDQYDVAFQTGAAMTYDQALEHTLRVLDDVINETNQTRNT